MKKILALCMLLLVLALAGCGSAPAKKTEAVKEPEVLNLFSWADNFDPEVLAAFEKEYNCKINYDVFANNEELLAKMQAGGAKAPAPGASASATAGWARGQEEAARPPPVRRRPTSRS